MKVDYHWVAMLKFRLFYVCGIYDYVFAVIRRANVIQIQALYHVLTFKLNNEIRQWLKEANPLLLLEKMPIMGWCVANKLWRSPG